MVGHTGNHWRLFQKGDIAWLAFAKENHRLNSLDLSALSELNLILDQLERARGLRGLIITSDVHNVFMVGIDLHLINALPNSEAVFHFMCQGQRILARLNTLKISTVALIQGLCLSTGLELALACRYRVAVINPRTRFGFTEIKLGLHSGWGGTVRVARLLGGIEALHLLLTGKTLSAKTALQWGLIDCLIPEEQAERAALYYAQVAPKPKSTQRATLRRLSHWPGIRNIIAALFRHQLRKKIKASSYPAPYQLLNHWQKTGVSLRAYRSEARSVSALAMTPTARELMHVHFLRQRLRLLGKKINTKTKFVHVMGVGHRGGAIAAWCALYGFEVTLQDCKPYSIALALIQAQRLFEKNLKQPHRIQAAMDRLIPDPQGYGIRRAEWIIDATCANLNFKKKLLLQWEAQNQTDALFIITSSQFILSELQKGLSNPERLIGFHCFNSIEKTSLIEVIHTTTHPKDILERAFCFVHQLNRLPLPVRNSPGFLINRLFIPYLFKAIALSEQGFSATTIDQTACHFGFAIGPLALADQIGLDRSLTMAKTFVTAFNGSIPEKLEKMVAKQQLGLKTGQGFYRYRQGVPFIEKYLAKNTTQKEIITSLLDPMIQEALRSLREQIVEDSDLLDAGLLFGFGFPAFRGGLLRYMNKNSSS